MQALSANLLRCWLDSCHLRIPSGISDRWEMVVILEGYLIDSLSFRIGSFSFGDFRMRRDQLLSRQLVRGFAWWSVLLLLSGCGGGSAVALVLVRGKVVSSGVPVTDVTVAFIPDKGPVATGHTNSNGQFELLTGDSRGVVKGKHSVTVTTRFIGANPTTGEKMMVSSIEVPPHYGNPQTSRLSFDIQQTTTDLIIEIDTSAPPSKRH